MLGESPLFAELLSGETIGFGELLLGSEGSDSPAWAGRKSALLLSDLLLF